MRKIFDVVIFLIGGVSYCLIEIAWRQRTHWSMLVLGGLCFLLLNKIYNKLQNNSLLEKCVVGAIVITALEFATGCVVNLIFGYEVWNYSRMPLNLFGQVCIVYSTLWGFLCIPINFLSKKINKYIRNSYFNSNTEISIEK